MTISVAWKGIPFKTGNSWSIRIPMDYIKYGLVDPEKEYTFKVEVEQKEVISNGDST